MLTGMGTNLLNFILKNFCNLAEERVVKLNRFNSIKPASYYNHHKKLSK